LLQGCCVSNGKLHGQLGRCCREGQRVTPLLGGHPGCSPTSTARFKRRSLTSFAGDFSVSAMTRPRRQTRSDAVAAGRSSTQTRPVSDKRPGKPRFLSSQRERFCQLIALRGYTASEAYREAYDAENSKDHTVHVEASRLRNDPEIAARIEQLKRPAIFNEERTKDAHVRNLRALRDLAALTGQVSAAIQAETNVGRVDGFYVEKRVEATAGLAELLAGSYASDETPKHEKGPVVSRAPRNRKKR
jgi:phage terminase small subunit